MADNAGKFTQEDVDKAIEAAVSKVQASVDKLETKNSELVAELRTTKQDLRKHKEIDPADVQKIEEERDALATQIADLKKENKKISTDLAKANETLASEQSHTSKLLIDNGLTSLLSKAGVKEASLQEALKAQFSPLAKIQAEGDNRTLMFGDKSAEDFVSEWAKSDAAKHFVTTGGNQGGGAPGNDKPGGGGGDKPSVTRSQFNAMDQVSRANHAKAGGVVVDD